VSFAAFKDIPWHLSGLAQGARSQVSTRTPYLDTDVVALAFQTPDVLWRSSLPALRLVSRNNPRLQTIPTDQGHVLGRSRLASRVRALHGRMTFKLDYWYNERMPSRLSVLDRYCSRLPPRYWPFGFHRYLSYRRWFRQPLAGYLRDRLADARARRSPVWEPALLAALGDPRMRDGENHVSVLNLVLTLDAVDRLLLRASAAQP
jgi:asparagine synthase (glutamine-hydrolysing)